MEIEYGYLVHPPADDLVDQISGEVGIDCPTLEFHPYCLVPLGRAHARCIKDWKIMVLQFRAG